MAAVYKDAILTTKVNDVDVELMVKTNVSNVYVDETTTLDKMLKNFVTFEETTESEDDQTVEALLLANLTLESNDEYIYLKYGDSVIGQIPNGGGTGTIACTSITIVQGDLTFRIGGTSTQLLTTQVEPYDCTQLIKWYTSDANVATVSSDGLVTIVGEGEATITAKCGNHTDTLLVTVTDPVIKNTAVYPGWAVNNSAATFEVYMQDTRAYMYYTEIRDSEYSSTNQIVPITAGNNYRIYCADISSAYEEADQIKIKVMEFSGRSRLNCTADWMTLPYEFTASGTADGVVLNILLVGTSGSELNLSTYSSWLTNNLKISEVV